jgi:hypothetical protein
MAKRGRKTQVGMYFGPVEEAAVARYMSLGMMVDNPEFPNDDNKKIWNGTDSEEKERDQIYNEFLKKPLNKMIEAIIRRYGLYRKLTTFDELHADTLSFLMTKAHKFENSRGKKAYSYYGTICKNYILGLLIKDEKTIKQITSYDDIYEVVEERDDLTYEMDASVVDAPSLINDITKEIRSELDLNDARERTYMNENERRVGEELINILQNWETVININGGNKYNKNSILSCLREGTHLNTKDIRNAMRKYKKMYTLILEEKLTNG